MSLFVLKKLVSALLLPPTGLLLTALAGLALRRRLPRLGALLAWTGLLALLALCLPYTAGRLSALAGEPPPLQPEDARSAQAIVILSGGALEYAPEYGAASPKPATLERLRYGARLARRFGLPVLVSGGAPAGGTPEALVMKETLERDFGVAVRWSESASLDTAQNALYSSDILERAGVKRILLVTHAVHMRRAQAHFAAFGLDVVPAPTRLREPFGVDTVFDLLPSMESLYASYLACHELAGQAVRRLGALR